MTVKIMAAGLAAALALGAASVAAHAGTIASSAHGLKATGTQIVDARYDNDDRGRWWARHHRFDNDDRGFGRRWWWRNHHRFDRDDDRRPTWRDRDAYRDRDDRRWR